MPIIECPICGRHELVPLAICEAVVDGLPVHRYDKDNTPVYRLPCNKCLESKASAVKDEQVVAKASGAYEETVVRSQSETHVQTPDFETWVAACFSLSQDDPFWNRSQLSGETLAEYLARLFETPSFLAGKYSRKQLGDGIWWICGCVSGFFHAAMESSVPTPARHRWIRSISTLYTDLFDPLSLAVSRRQQDRDALCVAAYMLWDMDSLSFAQTYPELREDCLEVLQVALNCRGDACIRSGLHGLGHWIERAEYDGDTELRSRLEQCIDDFIHRYRRNWRARLSESLDRFLRVRADPWPTVIRYAKDARSGCIM